MAAGLRQLAVEGAAAREMALQGGEIELVQRLDHRHARRQPAAAVPSEAVLPAAPDRRGTTP